MKFPVISVLGFGLLTETVYSQVPTSIGCSFNDTMFEDASSLLGELGELGPGLRGSAWFDYNNDGALDLFIPKSGDLPGLFKNNGDGTFTNIAAEAGFVSGNYNQALTGDLDNDGYPDVIMTRYDFNPIDGRTVWVYKNNGDGTFTDVTDNAEVEGTASMASGALGDYDNDGLLDIFLTGAGPSFLIVGENRSFFPNKLYKNIGNFSFTDVSSEAGIEAIFEGPNSDMEHPQACTVAFHDYNGDRNPDIIVGNCISEPVPGFNFFRNNGDGTFTDVTFEVGWDEPGVWMGMSPGDIDGDGLIDFYTGSTGIVPFVPVPAFEDGIYAHITFNANGNGTYTAEKGAWIPNHEFNWGAVLFDVDNDGDLDLATVGSLPFLGAVGPGISNPGRLFINDGPSQFNGSLCLYDKDLTFSFTGGLSSGDFDGDGYIDLLITPGLFLTETGDELPGAISTAILLRNKGGSTNFLTIKLVGTTSNRDGVGAIVRVNGQIREVKIGSSLMSVEQIWPHFGLGSASEPVDVEIQWPSGLDETFIGVEVNQVITLTEGGSTIPSTYSPTSSPMEGNTSPLASDASALVVSWMLPLFPSVIALLML